MLNAVRKALRRLRTDIAANFAIPFAVAVTPLVATAGMVIDVSHSHSAKVTLQDAADAAALTGAIHNSADPAARLNAAETVFNSNLLKADFPVSVTPTIGFANDAVTVSASTNIPTFLLGIIGKTDFSIDAAAVAERSEGAKVCMLALNSGSTKGIQITGSTSSVEAIGCAVHSNSSGGASIHNVSNATSVAASFCANGDVNGDNFSPSPLMGCKQVDDPYAGLDMPVTIGCDHNNYKVTGGEHSLNPGIYCGGISITGGTVNFAAGFYHIVGGSFKVAGGGNITGEEVTFYLRGDGAELDFSAQISADLTAPESGEYAGFLFIQHPDASAGSISKITGGADVNMVGTFYFPTQGLKMSGTGSLFANSPYSVFVADTFELKGNGQLTLQIDEEAAGFPAMGLAHSEIGARLIN